MLELIKLFFWLNGSNAYIMIIKIKIKRKKKEMGVDQMVQSINTKVDLIMNANSHNGISQYGKIMIGDKGFEFFNDRDREEKVKSVNGDYGRVYDDLYEAIINGKDKTITEEQTQLQIGMLETGVRNLK